MKIYRDFLSNKPGEGTCRVEITLTEKELIEAFVERQHELDLEDVDMFMRQFRHYEVLSDNEAETFANYYRSLEDDTVSEYWYDNMNYAYDEVMKRRDEIESSDC